MSQEYPCRVCVTTRTRRWNPNNRPLKTIVGLDPSQDFLTDHPPPYFMKYLNGVVFLRRTEAEGFKKSTVHRSGLYRVTPPTVGDPRLSITPSTLVLVGDTWQARVYPAQEPAQTKPEDDEPETVNPEDDEDEEEDEEEDDAQLDRLVSALPSEAHMDSLIRMNWQSLFPNLDFEGQQVRVGNARWPVDFLAIRRIDGANIILESKLGAPTDSCVGQVQRYIAAKKRDLRDSGLNVDVEGIIISPELPTDGFWFALTESRSKINFVRLVLTLSVTPVEVPTL